MRIDDTTPVTTSDIDEAWQNGPVDVTLTATDAVSGVAATYYSIDGGAETTYTAPFEISAEGTTTSSTGRSTSRGNIESATSVKVRIDDTAPVSSSDIDEAWQDGPVTVTLGSTDAGFSGVAATYYRSTAATEPPTPPRSRSAPRARRRRVLVGRHRRQHRDAALTARAHRRHDPVTTPTSPEAWQNGRST